MQIKKSIRKIIYSNPLSTSGDVYWHMRCYNDYKLGNINNSGLYDIFHGFNAEAFRNEFRKSDCCMTACTRCCGLMNSEQFFRLL